MPFVLTTVYLNTSQPLTFLCFLLSILVAGHQNELVDTPYCKVNGQWGRPRWANLDLLDPLNLRDDPHVIDRHACGFIDANNDGLLDIYCLVGANRGQGEGYNELYLSRPDGSIYKVLEHGLQRYTGSRTRATAVLKGPGSEEFVFVGSSYGPRADGRPNVHHMFRKNGSTINAPPQNRFFSHVLGPWETSRYTNVSCAIAADVNQDGLDDLILCNERRPGNIYMQTPTGWAPSSIPYQQGVGMNNWRAAAVADFSGDGIPDLAVTYDSRFSSFLRIFKGQREFPYFQFTSTNPWYQRYLPFAAPDIEALDINKDGKMDLYVVQADERPIANNYCGGQFNGNEPMWWTGGPSRIMPPPSFTPPPDRARDFVFLGARIRHPNRRRRMRKVRMRHAEPGCGFYAKKLDNSTLVLAQGGFIRPGHQLLLEW